MNIPYGFSELNTGVIGYKKCKNFQKFNLSSSHSSQLRNPVGVMIDYKFVKG